MNHIQKLIFSILAILTAITMAIAKDSQLPQKAWYYAEPIPGFDPKTPVFATITSPLATGFWPCSVTLGPVICSINGRQAYKFNSGGLLQGELFRDH